MNKLARQLNLYDKYLFLDKSLDGTLRVRRQSPFSNLQFDVLTVQNQYVGSGKWIMRKIMLKDAQRHDISGDVDRSNARLKERQKRGDNRIHREVADLITVDKIVL